ncbi:MAG: permease-like cell division protein FtsX [Dysgonamonadaceae bacterium]|jgi:cell division transport system permease protein|nr:permease-like cell division protein FtsX [Dysgonamonadaceae bacterium]
MKNKRTISSVTFINSKVTVIVSISLVLFLLGLILLLTVFADKLSAYMKESLSFDIILSDDTEAPQVNSLLMQLENAPFVKTAEYISKDEAARQYIGEDPSVFLGFNPLPSIIVVNLNAHYAEADSIPAIEKEIKNFSTNINAIEYRNDLLLMVNNNLNKLGIIFMILAVVLFVISVTLINNTIRLTVYSKRFLIHTMKLVGATPGFIRWPFIRANIFMGIVASVLANILLISFLYYVMSKLGDASAGGDITRISEIINFNALYTVFGVVLVLGVVISAMTTFFAVNRYIGMESDDLYYV